MKKFNKEKNRGRNKVLCVHFVRLRNKVGQKEGRKVVFGSLVRPLWIKKWLEDSLSIGMCLMPFINKDRQMDGLNGVLDVCHVRL